ncbi:MAG: hypothetical protein J6N21_23830, partial [Butyrivibrio sp.]|nr:hypothetical protein [Butyrivibrio sp.]
MFAYFNELSANGSIQEDSLPAVLRTLYECIERLRESHVSSICIDKNIGLYQLTTKRWFLDVLDDKTIVDDDMKTLFLDMMTTVEPPTSDTEDECLVQTTCNGENCVGLGLASEEINNTFAVSLSSTGWDETSYQLLLQRLLYENGDLVEQNVETSCRNVSTTVHIDAMASFFVPIPLSGRELLMRLSELFPHLVFSSKAKGQIKRNHDRPSIEQIYLKLQDINSAAQKLNNGVLRKELFHYKASPEHEQRGQLPEMDI